MRSYTELPCRTKTLYCRSARHKLFSWAVLSVLTSNGQIRDLDILFRQVALSRGVDRRSLPHARHVRIVNHTCIALKKTSRSADLGWGYGNMKSETMLTKSRPNKSRRVLFCAVTESACVLATFLLVICRKTSRIDCWCA